MSTERNEQVTPDRIKRLLSSFLISTKQSELEKRSTSISELTSEVKNDVEGPDNSQKSQVNLSLSRPKTQDPRSKEAFFKRLDTYTTFSWFAKPTELSPLVCARYGWQIIDTDMLECVGCKAKLCGQLPKTRDNYQDCCNKLKEKLKSSHQKSCSWSSNPSPESFSMVPVYDAKEVLADFHSRLESIQSCSSLPALSETSFKDQGIEEDQINRSIQSILGEEEEEVQDTAKSAFLLAICGWKLKDSRPPVLTCAYCQRSVGLWNYKHSLPNKSQMEQSLTVEDKESVEKNSDISEDRDDESSTGPVSKRMKMTEKDSFDPLSEHRYWCAWITSMSQQNQNTTDSPRLSTGNGDSALQENKVIKPWQTVLKVVCPTVFKDEMDVTISQQFKQNSPTAGLRQLRKMLREWSSPQKVPKKKIL